MIRKLLAIVVLGLLWGGNAYAEECLYGDCENGIGRMRTAAGDYSGEFKNGKFHGQGTYIWDEGMKYEGEFKNWKMHGQGKITNKYDDDIYNVEVKNNNCIKGTMVSKTNKLVYVGEFNKKCVPHGQGTITWSDGEEYVGQLKNGKRHGQGTHTFKSGKKYVGKFKNGEQVE